MADAKKEMTLGEYLSYPTLEELRGQGLQGSSLLGITYRADPQYAVSRLFTKTVEDHVSGEKVAVTSIVEVQLV